MTTAINMMNNEMNATVYTAVVDAESSADNTEYSAIIMMTTVFYELPFAIYDEDSSAAVTLKMISDKLDADTMFKLNTNT